MSDFADGLVDGLFDYLIFIGRFEPFHQGHEFVVNQALSHAKHVIMLIGSANAPRTIKNPFTFDERTNMILDNFPNDRHRIICLPIDDTLYNDDKWLKNIQNQVAQCTQGVPARIGIIGHHKDDSSYYLSLFPQWQFLSLPNFSGLSATPIRHAYLDAGKISPYLTQSSADFLNAFKNTADFAKLQREYRHIMQFRQSWHTAPYPPVFSTADALVVQAGHILLIERGGDYGQGLWALPGGFLDQNESLLACALRELHEETGLVIAKNSLKNQRTFDAPDRSPRGRTITHVFHFELQGDSLPKVSGGDDACRAFWLPLNQLDGKYLFEDHHSIITAMLGL